MPEAGDPEAEQVDDQDAREWRGRRRRRSWPAAAAGRRPGPGRLRRTASTSARARIRTSAIRKSWTLTQNAATIFGSESAKTSPLKNEFWTAGQPGALTTTIAEQTEEDDGADERDRASTGRRLGRSAGGNEAARPTETPISSPESRGPLGRPKTAHADWPRVAATGAKTGRARLLGEPLLGDLVERAVGLERGDRLVDAGRERAALGQHEAEVLGVGALAATGNWPTMTLLSSWAAVM